MKNQSSTKSRRIWDDQDRLSSVILWRIIDYVVIPLIIFFAVYNPHYADGILLHLEAGQHLGHINDILHGKFPYRDSFILYGPLSDLLPMLLMRMVGMTIETLRAYFHFSSILGLLIAYILAKRIFKVRFFAYIAIFLIVTVTFVPFWSPRWGGIRFGLGFFILLGLVSSFTDTVNRKWLVVTGAISTFALLNSTEIGLFGMFSAIVCFAAVMYQGKLSAKDITMIAVPYIAGAATVYLPFILYYAYAGAFGAYVQAVFFDIPFNHLSVFSQGGIPSFVPNSLSQVALADWILSYRFRIYLPALIYLGAVLYLVMAFTRKKIGRKEIILSVLTAYGIPLYLTGFRAIQGPQFESSIAPAILVACIALESLYEKARSLLYQRSFLWFPETKQGMVYAVALYCALVFVIFSENRTFGSLIGRVVSQVSISSNYQRNDTALVSLNLKRAGNIRLPEQQAREIEYTVNYILSHTASREPIFAFPDMGSYYFLADRPNICRYPAASYTFMMAKYRAELLQDLRKAAPRYVIFNVSRSALGVDQDLYPKVIQFLSTDYHVGVRYGNTLILRHN